MIVSLFLVQIGKLEDLRLRTLQGVLAVQKVFRGYKERRAFKRLRRATICAQACKSLAPLGWSVDTSSPELALCTPTVFRSP